MFHSRVKKLPLKKYLNNKDIFLPKGIRSVPTIVFLVARAPNEFGALATLSP